MEGILFLVKFRLLCLWVVVGTAMNPGSGTALAVNPDGNIEEWAALHPIVSDPVGDAPEGRLDLGGLWLANDGDYLAVVLEAGRETILQNVPDEPIGNDLELWIDGDNNAETGRLEGNLGADLVISFGRKRATHIHGAIEETYNLNEAGLVFGPTHSSDQFEMRLPKNLRPRNAEPIPIVTGDTIRLFFREVDGDRLPDAESVSYSYSTETASPVEPIALDRLDAKDIRFLCHNVEHTGPMKNPEPFKRFLRATEPDIVSYQETWDWTVENGRDFVASVLDPAPGGEWHAAKVEGNVTISRWPIYEAADVMENLVVYIDLPSDRSKRDLVLFNAHTPCCGNNDGRDEEHDAISSTWRKLMTGTGPFPIFPEDPMVALGDFNMVGFRRQLDTILNGEIIDELRFGSSFEPGRAEGSLRHVSFRHTHSRVSYTWRRDRSDFAPGKLDYLFYTGDAMELKKAYALYTDEMPLSVLNGHGLQLTDSSTASDHLVLIADFAFPTD